MNRYINRLIRHSISQNQRWLVPTLVYFIATVIILTAGYFYLVENRNNVFESAQSQLQTLNKLKKNEIQNWFKERDNDIAFYQQNSIFLQEVKSYLDSKDRNSGKLKQWLLQTQKAHRYDIFIIEKSGKLNFIIGTDSTNLSPFIIDTCVNSLMSEDHFFLDIYRRENTNKLFYASIGKLRLSNNSGFDACLVFRTNLNTYFIDDIVFDQTHSYNVAYSIVRNEGDSVFFVNSKKYTTLKSLAGGIVKKYDEAPMVQAIRGNEGIFTGTGPDGNEIIASITKIPLSKWMLVAHTNLDKVKAPLAEKKWIIVIYSLLFISTFILWHLRFVQKAKLKSLHEQIRLNKELISNREILQTIIQSSPLPLVVISKENKILVWNNAATEIFGWSYSEILKSSNPIFTGADQEEFGKIISTLEKTGSRYYYETVRTGKYGNIIHLSCCVTNLVDPLNKANNLLFVFEDISERKRISDEITQLNESLEQRVNDRTKEVAELNKSLTERANQLEEVNAELESFTYSVSHDLKAPLRSIQGFTDIILTDHSHELSDEVKRLFGIVKKNAARMDQLIKELLNLSKVTRLSLNYTTLNMNQIIEDVVNDNFSALLSKNITFEVDKLSPAVGDKSLIQQVWFNLISNAIKYSQKNVSPLIEISSTKRDQHIVYSIRDNGVGFNSEYYHKLFNTFQRLHSNDEFEGTGVGLAIVKRIVNRHAGDVWAESEEGKGATFYFSLPAPEHFTNKAVM